jgi:4-amino-4-deoxy-L-arabinose transferase-like glycosyltransferase
LRPRPSSSVSLKTVWRPVVILTIIATAALLRFYGLKWGLPNSVHDYSYHPDEFLTVGAAGRVLTKRTLDPGFYNYPALYIYLSAIAIAAGFAYGAAAVLRNLYLLARIVTALMGTAAVAVTYWAGSVCFGFGAGIIGALMLCIAPIHVQHSHFATVDVPSTLFVAAALGFAGLVLRDGSWKSYLFGGAMAGLAAATKYNAGLVLLALIAAHLLRGGDWRRMLGGKLWAAVGCAAAAFVTANPVSVLHTDKFLYGIRYELQHAAQGHGLVFVGTGNGFLYTLTSSLWYGLGPQVVLFIPAVIMAFVKRQKAALVILAFLIPYYALISLSQVRFARYALPMFPGIAILTGWFVVEVWTAIRRPRAKDAWALLCCLVLAWTFVVAGVYAAAFGKADPRDEAERWIRAHIPKGATIGVIDVPWFYSPPLSKNLGFGTLPQRERAMRKTSYRLCAIPVFHAYTCDWAVISDFEWRDALRLKNARSVSEEQRSRASYTVSQVRSVEKGFILRRRFGGTMNVLGRMGFPNPPHDMRYVRPQIKIYERMR